MGILSSGSGRIVVTTLQRTDVPNSVYLHALITDIQVNEAEWDPRATDAQRSVIRNLRDEMKSLLWTRAPAEAESDRARVRKELLRIWGWRIDALKALDRLDRIEAVLGLSGLAS